MFCHPCEQTKGGKGCTACGICGKDPTTVLNVLVETFGLAPITAPEEDLAAVLG